MYRILKKKNRKSDEQLAKRGYRDGRISNSAGSFRIHQTRFLRAGPMNVYCARIAFGTGRKYYTARIVPQAARISLNKRYGAAR